MPSSKDSSGEIILIKNCFSKDHPLSEFLFLYSYLKTYFFSLLNTRYSLLCPFLFVACFFHNIFKYFSINLDYEKL